jgi:hypothetical protein
MSVTTESLKAREWNPDNNLDVALMKMEFDIAMENTISNFGKYTIHVDNVVKCTPYFRTKVLNPDQVKNIITGFHWSLSKRAMFVLDLDPTHENTKPAIDWYNVMIGRGKTNEDIIKMFSEPPDTKLQDRVPPHVKLVAMAGQHSTMAAQALLAKYTEEKPIGWQELVNGVATREAVVFIAGLPGGLTDDQFMTIGHYDNVNTKVMEMKTDPPSLLEMFITHAEGLNLRKPADRTQ